MSTIEYDTSSLYDLTDTFSKPIYFEIFISLTLWTLWFLAVVGNVLVLIIFMRDRTLRNKVANRYILNLALADLLVGLNSLTMTNIWRYYGNWPFGEFFCKMYVAVDYSAVCQSILAITLISFDRYMLVTKELTYGKYQTKRTGWVLIGATWTFSFALFVLPVLLYEALTADPIIRPYHVTCYLEVMYLKEYNIAILVLTFIVPTAILAFFNLSVFINIYRRSRGLVRTRILTVSDSTSNSGDEQWANPRARQGPGSLPDLNPILDTGVGGAAVSVADSERVTGRSSRRAPQKIISYRRHYKAAVTLSLLVGLFLVCATPLYVFKFMLAFSGVDHAWIWWNLVGYMVWANSAINPFLYAVTNTGIRAGYKSILCFWRKSQRVRPVVIL